MKLSKELIRVKEPLDIPFNKPVFVVWNDRVTALNVREPYGSPNPFIRNFYGKLKSMNGSHYAFLSETETINVPRTDDIFFCELEVTTTDLEGEELVFK